MEVARASLRRFPQPTSAHDRVGDGNCIAPCGVLEHHFGTAGREQLFFDANDDGGADHGRSDHINNDD